MVKLKGALLRAKKEYRYMTMQGWSLKEMGEFWDTVKDYDEIDDETYAYKRRFYDSIAMANIKGKKKFLDIDCRTGNGAVFYHQHGKVKHATCITPSKDFLRVSKARLKKYGVDSDSYLLRKLPLPFRDESFDVILFLETIEHIAPKKRLTFLRELRRLLKKDGMMILSMPNILWEPIHWFTAIFGIHHSEGPHRFLSRKELENLLARSGFKIMKEKTTVIIPIGPRWLTRFGEKLEKLFENTLLPLIGLRRIYICKKL